MVTACQRPLFTSGKEGNAATCPAGTGVQSIDPFWKASIIDVTLLNTS